ncbi:MAG: 4-hydroxythreonine-4-phosphate dehydrogenase PdxA [Rhodospirillaceae bacterium]|nr:4-hydroxythreonine-4-phosphate dehydrogenase PdxA [Rhodospirillaceae bacterium]|tara:strand:- start:6605 stop:7612 length:1008 start_codon:yes stop_codon:yes gene_type:complete
MKKLPIVVTPGEPAGVGAEITLKAWQDGSCPPFFLIDDPKRVINRAKYAKLDVPTQVIKSPLEANKVFSSALPILPCEFPVHCDPGNPSVDNSPTIIKAIEMAVDFTNNNKARSVVTNPIQKNTLTQSGFTYPGHTEFLASLSKIRCIPVMLLRSKQLSVVPVTIHEPISEVSKLLTTDLIIRTAMITANSLQVDFGITQPRLWLSGLNPHAGESDTIGTEETTIIKPAIDCIRAQGIKAAGPIPADSMFHSDARKKYDVAICMYHDQALIPLKTLDFWNSVNVTIGLPFVRTSPDHGTALEIAGSGKARPSSLISAIQLADELERNRSRRMSSE